MTAKPRTGPADLAPSDESEAIADWTRSPSFERLVRDAVDARARLGALSEASLVARWIETADARRAADDELRGALLRLGAYVADAAELAIDAARLGAVAHATTTPPDHAPSTAPAIDAATTAAADEEAPGPESAPAAPAPVRFATVVSPPAASPAAGSGVALTGDVLARLRDAMKDRQLGDTPATRENEASVCATLRDAIEKLGPTPRPDNGKKKRDREMETLLATVESELERWAALPAHCNHALTSWLAARLRAAQHAAGLAPDDVPPHSPIAAAFRALGQHSKSSRPGVVHGLAQRHQPRGAGWLADAREEEERVRALAGLDAGPAEKRPNIDDLYRRLTEEARDGIAAFDFIARTQELLDAGARPGDKRLAHLAMPFAEDLRDAGLHDVARAAVALAEAEAEVGDTEPRSNAVPDDWPFLHVTEGKRAAIVGGEPRAERVEKLREAFRFAEVDWVAKPNAGGRALDSLIERMQSGNVDVVIALRAFSSHKLTDKLFANRVDSCRLVLADTYGVTQVRLGVERFCR